MESHGDEHLTWDDEPIHLDQWEIDEALADYKYKQQVEV